MSDGAINVSLGVLNANGTTKVWDANEGFARLTFAVFADATVTGYSVQFTGSLDGVNFVNVGFPVAAAGTLTTTIGPVANTTYKFATWNQSPFRYFQAALSGYAGSGNVTIQVGCGR